MRHHGRSNPLANDFNPYRNRRTCGWSRAGGRVAARVCGVRGSGVCQSAATAGADAMNDVIVFLVMFAAGCVNFALGYLDGRRDQRIEDGENIEGESQ